MRFPFFPFVVSLSNHNGQFAVIPASAEVEGF
jgi:hypothetical protein